MRAFMLSSTGLRRSRVARRAVVHTTIRPEHEVKFYQLLGGGLKDAGWQREHMSQNRLAILPNLTHYEMGTAPELADTALPFLNGVAAPKDGTSP